MKKYIAAALILIVLIAAGGAFAFFHFFNGGSWQGTWWGVQDAVNWTVDNMQNLETVTFTRNDDGTITVDHKVQVGSREIEGSLSGEGKVDGGRLQVTLKNGKTESFSYNAVDKTIATPLTNADDTPVTLKELTGDNNDEMERIRSQIVQISQKPENKIDKTLASSRS